MTVTRTQREPLQVWKDHQLIEFPWDANTELRGEVLTVRDRAGKTLQVFQPGEWHAFGRGIPCAFLEDDPGCTNCYPPAG